MKVLHWMVYEQYRCIIIFCDYEFKINIPQDISFLFHKVRCFIRTRSLFW